MHIRRRSRHSAQLLSGIAGEALPMIYPCRVLCQIQVVSLLMRVSCAIEQVQSGVEESGFFVTGDYTRIRESD